MNLKNIRLDEELSINVPDLEEVKIFLGKRFKKYGYITLFITIKIYLLSRNTIKKYTVKIIRKIKNKIKKEDINQKEVKKEKEASKFIKTIREYKDKIKRITYKIKKEKGLN